MSFSEDVKSRVRRHAHFACCLCHSLYVEVHHIEPQAEGGDDTEDNAAPLCPSCHEMLGANPTKRRFIREARDCWYEICEKRYASDPDRLSDIARMLGQAATKADLDAVVALFTKMMNEASAKPAQTVAERARTIGEVGSFIAPGVSAGRHCKKCGTTIGLFVGDQGRCPSCGTPW